MKPGEQHDDGEAPSNEGGAEPDAWQDPFLRGLAAAQAGDREALGDAFEPFRRFLLLIAERELATDLKSKEGASDLVQDTLLEAQRHIGSFEGRSPQELRSWLRHMLLHRVSYTSRRYRGTAKRRMAREQPLGSDRVQARTGRIAGERLDLAQRPGRT